MDNGVFDSFDDILLQSADQNILSEEEYYANMAKEYSDFEKQCEDEEYIIDYNIVVSGLVKNLAEKNLNEKDIEVISKKFFEMYQKDVRNNYYILFTTIAEISKGNIESFDALNVNIDNLNNFAKKSYKGNKKVIMGFDKLNQYIKLEANRASFNQVQIKKLGLATKEFENQKQELELHKQELQDMETRLKEYENKLSVAESGYINNLLSVLGVFSGIIIAFFGGLEYITSVFNNIGNVSKYRLVFISLMLGFVIFNTVSAMLVFLGKMTDKDIYRPCKTPNCSCDKRCNIIKRIKNKLLYVYGVNFVIILMMIGTIGLWILDLCF